MLLDSGDAILKLVMFNNNGRTGWIYNPLATIGMTETLFTVKCH